ncbi:uncharacterized protein N7484_009842 [Penicillium longicatenatum]|uniref:uncharacterized protein n=1 Tax=Penicillium longicatenatum TaxID=1561947 RepID=UPI002547EFB4|nr:uncharacterized protein N7484_009842 [Penicillium longicatenatum]KAJ5636529.1 hypothetical protein N7484_009842 [Penicillium longicatenatum]
MDTQKPLRDESQSGPTSAVAEIDDQVCIFEPTGPSMGRLRRRSVMFSLCLAMFLSALDVTIVATALPTIARQVNASTAGYAWIGSAYTLSNTASVPVWAQLSNIFGRKPIIMLANLAFLGGSLICGLAKSVGMLIGGRVVQGLGGGGCLIMVTIIIGDMFEVKERAKYYGLTGIVWAISSGIGPILGGVFTQTIGWRWCFLINLPFDGLSLGVLFIALKSQAKTVPVMTGLKQLDWIGSLLIIGGTICFLYGLEVGASGEGLWGSPMVICLLVFGVVILGLFSFYEARFATNPLIPSRVLSSRSNCASITVLCLHSFVFISYDYFLPLYFQVVLGFRAIISGVSLLALVVPLSAFTMGTGWYVRRKGDYQWPIWIGSCFMTMGTGLFISFDSVVSWPKIIIFQVIVSIGAGPLFQSPMIALQSHVRQVDIAAAMSAASFMRSLCSSMSIVIGSVLLQKTLHGGKLTLENETDVNQDTDQVSSDENSAWALSIMWIFYTAMCGAMILASLFIKRIVSQKETRHPENEDVIEKI